MEQIFSESVRLTQCPLNKKYYEKSLSIFSPHTLLDHLHTVRITTPPLTYCVYISCCNPDADAFGRKR